MSDIFAAAWTALLRFIEEQRAAAIYLGIQPTEVWLGPEEHSVFHWVSQQPEITIRMRPPDPFFGRGKISGLTVRKSLEPGIRVGVSFPLDGESTAVVRSAGKLPADLRAFAGEGGGA